MNTGGWALWGGPVLGALSVGLVAGLGARWLLTRLPSISFTGPRFPALPKGTQLSPVQGLLGMGLFVCFLVMAFGDFATGLLLAVLGVLGWYSVQKGPEIKKKYEFGKRLEKMREVFPQTLGMAVQAIKTGQTVPQVLEYLSRECPPSLREELVLVCVEMNLGNSAEMSLSKMADRYPDFTEFHHFIESYKISRQTGANLTHLLEVLLEGLEEKSRLLRKMQAMTAQARLSGILMGLLPFLLAFVFWVIDPDLMTPLFTQKIGWAILLGALFWEGIGFVVIRHLLQLEF